MGGADVCIPGFLALTPPLQKFPWVLRLRGCISNGAGGGISVPWVISVFQASSPACTELEMGVMDWLAKMLGLPEHFLHHHPSSRGGGVLQVPVMTAFLLTLGPGTGSKDKSFPQFPAP